MGASLDFRSFIASSLAVSGIFDILGYPSAGNQIVYTAWPQVQPKLAGTVTAEPSTTGGWMVFRVDDFVRKQDILEFKRVYLDTWATRPLILEQVKDQTDAMFNLRLSGQNGLAVSSFNITYSQLAQSTDLFEEETRLYRKQVLYEFRLVRRPIGV